MSIEATLGLPKDVTVAAKILKIYPVCLNDWPAFSRVVDILNIDNLYEIHVFTDGSDQLRLLLRIVSRIPDGTDTPEEIGLITEKEFQEIRATILAQNGIDFERFHKKLEKIEEKDKGKNIAPPL
jgi:hypothetical protein